VALILALAVGPWFLPGTAYADLKLATLTVKGMVCQA
jgi:hypothetical protein